MRTTSGNVRIAHIISGLRTGGAERALCRLLAAGLEGPFENHVISLGDRGTQSDAIESSGATVHCLNIRGLLAAPAGIMRLNRLVHRIRPSVLQGWMYHGNLAATLAAELRPGSSLVWNIRQSLDDLSGDKWLTRQIIWTGKLLSGRADRIIYNSAASARHHVSFGYDDRNGIVIPNGFEVTRVVPDFEAAARFRAKMGIGAGTALFAHVARFHPMKDHASFMSAATIALERGSDAHFALAGKGVDAESVLIDTIVPSHHRHRFSFLGELGDAIPLIQAADALVVSSRRAEGFPNVIGEAMMVATPCIATDTGDCAAILAGTGLIVPPRDHNALAAAISALASDPDMRRKMGRKARAEVCRRYDVKVVADRYRVLYEDLLIRSGSR